MSIEKVVELLKHGRSIRSIAEEMGISHVALLKRLRKAGINYREIQAKAQKVTKKVTKTVTKKVVTREKVMQIFQQLDKIEDLSNRLLWGGKTKKLYGMTPRQIYDEIKERISAIRTMLIEVMA